jgi:hypothetical protein
MFKTRKSILSVLLIIALTFSFATAFAADGRVTSTLENADATAFSFMFLGDIQVAESTEIDFAAWGKLVEAAYERNPGLAFALQAGDIVESGINAEQWDAFLTNAEPVFSKIPFFPTNGNHESNFLSGKPELYLETFDLPLNGPAGFEEEFYSFDYGNAHVIVLNSWVFSGEQKLTDADFDVLDAWVALDLASSDATWTIALTHVPLYEVHSDTTATKAREHWISILEKYGVDVLFVGHQHVYSRLKPLIGGVEDENGLTQIMGNSGLKFYDSADEILAERTIYNVSNYEIVTIDGDSLIVQAFDIDGNEFDYLELAPRVAEVPTRAEFLDLVYRRCGSPEVVSGQAFADVPTNSQYSDAIQWARNVGLVVGIGGNLFAPELPINNAQMRIVLDRFEVLEK